MKLTAKQALVLFEIAKDTCNIVGLVAGYSSDVRLGLVNQIIQQQSDKLIDLENDDVRKS